jgi:hypothetical protein
MGIFKGSIGVEKKRQASDIVLGREERVATRDKMRDGTALIQRIDGSQ